MQGNLGPEAVSLKVRTYGKCGQTASSAAKSWPPAAHAAAANSNASSAACLCLCIISQPHPRYSSIDNSNLNNRHSLEIQRSWSDWWELLNAGQGQQDPAETHAKAPFAPGPRRGFSSGGRGRSWDRETGEPAAPDSKIKKAACNPKTWKAAVSRRGIASCRRQGEPDMAKSKRLDNESDITKLFLPTLLAQTVGSPCAPQK